MDKAELSKLIGMCDDAVTDMFEARKRIDRAIDKVEDILVALSIERDER